MKYFFDYFYRKIDVVMRNIVVRLMVVILLLVGCSKNERELLPSNVTSEKSHVIPVEEVLASLECYSNSFTKSSSNKRVVKNIFAVGYSGHTKSSDLDTLLYVANFEDNRGYAIMSADYRIKESLIAFSEVGSLDSSDFYNNDFNPLLDTVDFYDEYLDDYLIGGSNEGGEKYILQGIVEYANYQINKSSNEPVTDIGDDNPYFDLPGVVRPDTWIEIRNVVYETVDDVEPLLNTRWHQSSPYNDMVVPHGSYAGCVPVAVAQIMAFNKYPANFTINGINIVWDKITQKSYVPVNTSEALMVAALIGCIQTACHSVSFGGSGTFTFPCYVEDYLKQIGYVNVLRTKKYNEDAVIKAIKGGYPVFMSGMDGIKVWNAHAWVADGVKREVRKFDRYDHASGEYIDSQSVIAWNHIHCVWGTTSTWVANGYFKYNGEVYDTFRVITYEVPED